MLITYNISLFIVIIPAELHGVWGGAIKTEWAEAV
jgi:hypothetical protein